MKHYNSSISEDAMRIFNTKSFDNISSDVSPIIQPTIEIRRKSDFLLNTTANTTGTLTISVPSDKDTYLCGFNASFIKDVTCDSATGRYTITATVDGVSRIIGQFPVITLTAQNMVIVEEFSNPIKLDRGSSITMTGTFTAGVCVRCISCHGYIVETTKGT